jgi:hypothetical protein
MMYVDFSAGGKDYKLRLNTRNTVTLEKQLGCNPLAIFGDGDTMPTITTMVQVLYCSLLQLNHGITLDDTYNIFDEYLADGNGATDFLGVMIDIFKVSGLIKADKVDEKN